jgi:hypothetical protein
MIAVCELFKALTAEQIDGLFKTKAE